jgi:hypothetical protein
MLISPSFQSAKHKSMGPAQQERTGCTAYAFAYVSQLQLLLTLLYFEKR